jgi:hypothetical protein
MRIALVDLTNGATCADGTSLTPAILAQFAEAYTIQLNRDYSAEHGGNFEVRAASGAGDLQAQEVPFAWLPSFADAPGAIAYHSSNGNGMPLLFDAITLSDTVNGPGNSASVAGSHESLETPGDEGTNVWCDDADPPTRQVAREMCDAFENQSYPITISGGAQVWVSNFATRAFFVPNRAGPYSYMAAAGMGSIDAPSPLVTPAGQGYQVVRTLTVNSEGAVNGFRVTVEGEMKRRPLGHQWSRKHRRGLRA